MPGNELASKTSLEGIVFDGVNLPGLEDSGANCFVGFSVTSSGALTYTKKANISAFRFFMDYFSNRAVYTDTLELQGSNDDFGSDINTLATVGSELHEGWNSYDLPSLASYSAYRLFNSQNNGCN